MPGVMRTNAEPMLWREGPDAAPASATKQVEAVEVKYLAPRRPSTLHHLRLAFHLGDTPMAHSIQRLTMFALISALEIDLREFLALHVIPTVKEENLLPPAIYAKSVERFNREIANETPTVRILLDFLDLGDEINLIRKHENNLDNATKSYIKKYYFGF
jgi:hypothetical protein